MKITRIKIENFRSIKLSEFSTTDFNIFVGQNNCGKTNFFEAIEFFFNGKSKSTRIDDLKYKRQNDLEIIVAKNRYGATGFGKVCIYPQFFDNYIKYYYKD